MGIVIRVNGSGTTAVNRARPQIVEATDFFGELDRSDPKALRKLDSRGDLWQFTCLWVEAPQAMAS
jgi:hypothetical protein